MLSARREIPEKVLKDIKTNAFVFFYSNNLEKLAASTLEYFGFWSSLRGIPVIVSSSGSKYENLSTSL